MGYERFLGPEMFFHPVSISDLILCFGRNLFTKTGEHLWMRLLMMLFRCVQWIIEDNYTKTLFFQEEAPFSKALIKNLKNLSKKELTQDSMDMRKLSERSQHLSKLT